MEFSPLQIMAISIILSLIPAFIWGSIFLYKHGEKSDQIVRAFMLGGVMVVPLMIYRLIWEYYPSISLVEYLKPLENKSIILSLFSSSFSIIIPLSVLLFFITVGILEEYLKYRVVRSVDKKNIKTVDDAIEFSIIVALGFSFAENTLYFIEVWQSFGSDYITKVFIFRSVYSTFAHVLFSSIYGYHFGLALFAAPKYKEECQKSRYRNLIYKLHKLTRIKGKSLFEDAHIFLGLFYAASLHAIYNILIELNHTRFLLPFMILGVIHVLVLIWRRDNHTHYKLSDQSKDL